MRWLSAVVCCLLSLTPIHAQPVKLLGLDLEPRDVLLRSFTPDGVEVIDRQGETLHLKPDEILRLTTQVPPKPKASADHLVATLRDGQVLVGRLLGPGEGGESVRIALAAGGQAVTLSLDDLASIATDRANTVLPAGEDDAVLLVTGETMAGFVESFGEGTVGFILGDADEPISLPMERIDAIAIANPPRPVKPEQGMVRVLLADDTALLLRSATITQATDTNAQMLLGEALLPIDESSMSIPMSSVRRIDMLSGSYRLMPLTEFDVVLLAGGEVFGVPMPPRVEHDGSIRLHAPTMLGFELPRGVARLKLVAELVLGSDIPGQRRGLAGCELVVYESDRVVGSCTLLPDQPARYVSLSLTKPGLRLEVKPGVNGPVLDRVLIREAEVLIRE